MIGQTVAHYRITAKLGEGGMGAVYRADDLRLKRAVALKFLPAEAAADKLYRQRMLNEARVASQLNHPHIGTVYEISEEGESPFIAMELVSGESLKDMLRRGPLPPDSLAELARQIAEGLQEAHQAGVTHRDIKPANIMVDARRRVKILDFGLAVMSERGRGAGETVEAFVTRTATSWSTGGTVPYMAPEQLRGEATDARSDIFSFGVMLYECLAGRLPFTGETSIDILHSILRQPHAPLGNAVPDVSPEWEQIVDRCLAKSPEQRFRSMGEVLEALKHIGSGTAKAEQSLAVLYFENLSGAKEDEYFRDGITEDVITELSKIRGLRVFPRSAVLAFRDKPSTAPQIGQQLNASHVLEGSLRRAGNRLRITTQLVETRTGHTAWAERYDRQMEDVFAIQDEIAQAIAHALRLMLTEKEKRAIEKAPTRDVQAYDYYLRGRQFFHQFRKKGFDFARQMFARAIVIDPGYARAYAGVADCCSFLYMYWESSEENLKEADAASRKAIELDPESAEAHASRGLAVSLRRHYDEARREFETAAQLNPKLFEAYYFYARACVAEGRHEEAARWFDQAWQVHPEDYQSPRLQACAYVALGRKAEAEAANRRCLEVIERHIRFHPDDPRALYIGAQALCELGDRQRSAQWARQALELDPDDSGVLYNVACVYALQGETEQALECLERSVTSGLAQKEWIENDSDLNSLRAHPRFTALLQRLKATQ